MISEELLFFSFFRNKENFVILSKILVLISVPRLEIGSSFDITLAVLRGKRN